MIPHTHEVRIFVELILLYLDYKISSGDFRSITMHPKLSAIKTDLIQKDGNLSHESIPSSSSSICYTCSSTPFPCSNHPAHWKFVLKATVNAFCLADLRKMAPQWITTAGRKDNVRCAIVPTILGINCRRLSVQTTITILEVISDVTWKPLLLM
jgi:hypothetical protein